MKWEWPINLNLSKERNFENDIKLEDVYNQKNKGCLKLKNSPE